MRQKIENNLYITCSNVDLTTVTNIEFYVRQLNFFGCYSPQVLSANEMLVVIPFEDACKLRKGTAEVQFAFVEANGTPRATDPMEVTVGNMLKEDGYAPL